MKRVKISDWSLAAPGRGALRAAVDGILLLLTLWGTVFTVTSAYGIEADALWLGSVCFLLCALFLFLFSWTPAMLPGAILIAALWGTAVWLKRDVMRDGALQIAGYVLDTLSEVFDVGRPIIPDLSAAARRELVTWTLTAAVVPWGGLLGWSVVRARSPALTLLLSLLLFLPALLAEAVPDWLPLMALVFCYCLLLLTSLSSRHDPRGSARFALLCMPFVALLLGGLTLSLPETYTAPQWAGAFRSRAEEAAASLMENSRLDGLLPSGSVETTVRLDRAGPRQFTGRTMFTVSGDTPGRVYLRGISAANYTGSAWEPLDDGVYAEIGLDGDGGLISDVSPFNLPSLTALERNYGELRIDYGNSLSGCMYTPYQLATAPDEIEGVVFQNDSWLSRRFGVQEKNLFYRPDASPDNPGVLSGHAAGAEETYRQFVYKYYTALPAGFQQTLDRWQNRINEVVSNNPDAQEHAARLWYGSSYRNQPNGWPLLLADWYALLLELSAEYDLNTPYTPDDADFVDYFLNESQRGYCVHFASAGVLLMRAEGIPARYVEGYTAVVPEYGEAPVLDSDAHAWVEIYLDGYGWYPVDMTPPDGTGIESHSTLGVKLPDEPEKGTNEDDETNTDEEKAPSTPDISKPESAPSSPKAAQADSGKTISRSILWLWVPLLVLTLAVLLGQSALRRELLDRRFNASGTNRAAIAAYGYLERLARWGGVMEPEAVSLAQKAKFSQHALTETERDSMLAFTENQRINVWNGLPWWKKPLFWLSGL